MTFGAEVRQRRQALGMTLDDLAERSGLTAHYLSTVENDHRDPRLSTVLALAEALRVAPGDLMGPGSPRADAPVTALFENAPPAAQDAVTTLLQLVVASRKPARRAKKRSRRRG